MLSFGHERIESQLRALEYLVQHLAHWGCDAAAQSAARDVARYFDSAGAQHHRDEDRDLFPMLRGLAGRLGRPEVAAVIDELEREHATMDAQWRRLRPRLHAIAKARSRALDAEEIDRFAWLYRRHMDREAAVVLPFAREALSVEHQAALGERMAVRRRSAR
ncbi:MAG: hemerythrin domain-containing protein [Burkholderiales bacterium]